MVQKVKMRDVVIVIPGITGSVLQKDGRDLWALSGTSALSLVTSFGASLQHLRLQHDDLDANDLGDGIRATRVVAGAHIIPGLVKVDGYAVLSRMVQDNFSLHRGTIEGNEAANFFEFPYDWRRDCRVAALQLKSLIDKRLPQWQESSGATDAKVIFLAHSMGGLVARYYLEVLAGWENCKGLMTFGTPYRGSVNALGFLANGYHLAGLDLTEVLQSTTSVYQLLPIYKMVKQLYGEYERVAEIERVPNVDPARAMAALSFHREIEAAVESNLKDSRYHEHGYKIIPYVGTKQPTYQSAEMLGDTLTLKREVPHGMSELLADGDGTVPYGSAIPIELSEDYRDSFFPQRHSSLPMDPIILNHVRDRLRRMQVSSALRHLRGRVEFQLDGYEEPAISLHLEDAYEVGQPFRLEAQLLNCDSGTDQLTARITPIHGLGETRVVAFHRQSDGWELELEGLSVGLHRVEVAVSLVGPQPIIDLFEVVPAVR